MGTCNFWTMKDFPLYVHDDFYCIRCPECGSLLRKDELESEDNFCWSCGTQIVYNDHEEIYDELTTDDWTKFVMEAVEELFDDLMFHTVKLKYGYYSGRQLYVEEIEDPNDYDNEGCHYQFDCCRSKAIRKYESEKNKIRRLMKQIAKDYGMEEIYCVGVFSNGEAVYSRVPDRKSTKRERVKHAVAVS